MIRRFGVLVVVLFFVLVPARAYAQLDSPPTFDDPFSQTPDQQGPDQQGPELQAPQGPLNVSVHLSDARNADTIEIKVPRDVLGDHGYDFGRSMSEALGAQRSEAHVSVNTYSNPSKGLLDLTNDRVLVSLDHRLSKKSGDTWTYSVDSTEAIRVARQYNFDVLQLEVCPARVSVTDDSTPGPAARNDKQNGCRTWTESTSTTLRAPMIKIVQTSNVGDFRSLIASLAIAAIALSIVGAIVSLIIRNKVTKTLRWPAIASALALTAVGALVSLVAFAVFSLEHRPFTDFVLANDLSVVGAGVMRAMPALLLGLPFVVCAWIFLSVRPPEDIAVPRAPKTQPQQQQWDQSQHHYWQHQAWQQQQWPQQQQPQHWPQQPTQGDQPPANQPPANQQAGDWNPPA